jgi:hypothetical protein
MAGYIDRQWVNKEIYNFNRGMHPYGRDDGARIDRLVDAIIVHLAIKDPTLKRDVKEHIRLSFDDEDNQMHTDAAEIVGIVNRTRRETPDYARSSAALDKMDAKGVAEKLLGEMDDAEGGEHLEVTGPQAVENEAAREADALEDAAQRLAGNVDRRANANNPQLTARIAQARRLVSDLCGDVEGID